LEGQGYEELLERVLSATPTQGPTKRLEVPPARSFTEGMKTVIANLDKISQVLARDEQHLLKYLVKRLATSGSKAGDKIVLKGRFTSQQLNSLVEEYIKEYVYCSVCNRPDTSITKEKGIVYLMCSSCGARVAVRKI